MAFTIADVWKFFCNGGKDSLTYNGYSLTAFQKDWKLMSDTDKVQIRTGIQDGTFNY